MVHQCPAVTLRRFFSRIHRKYGPAGQRGGQRQNPPGRPSGSGKHVVQRVGFVQSDRWLYKRVNSVSVAPHPKRIPKLWARDRM